MTKIGDSKMAATTSLKPRKMTQEQINGYTVLFGKMVGFSGGIFSHVTAGQKWPGLKGEGYRFVMDASNYGVVFIQNNEVYYQDAQGWVEDYRTYGSVRGAQGAVGMADLSIFTVDIILGIVAKVSGAGFITVVGTDVFKFVHTNKDKFPKWFNVLKAIATADAVLKTTAPTLYRHVIYVTLKQTIKDGLPLLMEMLPFVAKISLPNLGKAADINSKKSGRGLGKLIGKLGVQALTSRLKLFGGLITIILFAVVQCLKAIPTSVKIRAGEHKRLAKDILGEFKKANIHLQPNVAEKIVEEIVKNGARIKAVLNDLNAAIAALN
jgi:hypothetical protein